MCVGLGSWSLGKTKPEAQREMVENKKKRGGTISSSHLSSEVLNTHWDLVLCVVASIPLLQGCYRARASL